MKEKALTCIQCGSPFTITGKDQEKLSSKGFGIPKRCPDCRKNKSKISGTIEDWEPKSRKSQGRGKKSLFEEEY